MDIKNCAACGFKLTTKNAINKGRNTWALFFNCPKCDGTATLRSKNWEEIVMKELEEIKKEAA